MQSLPGDCRCRQLTELHKGFACHGPDRQTAAGGVYSLPLEWNHSQQVFTPTVCFSVWNAAGKKQWFLPAEACLGDPIRIMRAVRREASVPGRGGAGPPSQRRGESPQEGVDLLQEDSTSTGREEQGVWGQQRGQRPDQSRGRERVPTGILGVECGAGGAPPCAPWAPGLWPPPHLPMSLAGVFIPSSGPFGPPW